MQRVSVMSGRSRAARRAGASWLALALLGLVLGGCGEREVPRGRGFGSLSVGGTALAEGRIRFFPLGEGIGSDSEIVAGKYEIPADRGLSAGRYRVEVSFLKATGKKVPNYDGEPGAMMDEIIETISPRYNRNSELAVDYDPSAEAQFDFELEP